MVAGRYKISIGSRSEAERRKDILQIPWRISDGTDVMQASPYIFSGGNKGALRIPSLSFQLLRRPGCTAKLLCFQYIGGFAPHRPCHLLSFFSIRCQDFQGALRGAKQRLAAWATLPVHVSFRVADNPGAIGWRLESKWRVRPF